jgi:hypothetical protein
MQRLESLKTKTIEELQYFEKTNHGGDMPASLKDYQAYLTTMRSLLKIVRSPELQSKLIKCLIHRIEVLSEGLRIHYYVGKERILTKKKKNPATLQSRRPLQVFLGSMVRKD